MTSPNLGDRFEPPELIRRRAQSSIRNVVVKTVAGTILLIAIGVAMFRFVPVSSLTYFLMGAMSVSWALMVEAAIKAIAASLRLVKLIDLIEHWNTKRKAG